MSCSLKTVSGNSLDLCEKYDTFGFESESECIHTSNNLAKSWQTAIRASNLLGIVSQNVSSKLEKLFVMEYLNKFKNQKLRMQDRTLTDGAQFLSQKGLPPKKRVTLKDVNKEQGFDLTKEEITKFKIWDKGVIPYFIDEHSFGKFLTIKQYKSLSLWFRTTRVVIISLCNKTYKCKSHLHFLLLQVHANVVSLVTLEI